MKANPHLLGDWLNKNRDKAIADVVLADKVEEGVAAYERFRDGKQTTKEKIADWLGERMSLGMLIGGTLLIPSHSIFYKALGVWLLYGYWKMGQIR